MRLLTFSTDNNSAQRLGAHLKGTTILDLTRAFETQFQARAPDWFGSTVEVLMGELGLDPDRFAELVAAGVIW